MAVYVDELSFFLVLCVMVCYAGAHVEETTMVTRLSKQCSRCGATKRIAAFARRGDTKDGRASHCKVCTAKATAAWRRRLVRRGPVTVAKKKRCSRCGVVKPASAFSPNHADTRGLASHCKACAVVSQRERRRRLAQREEIDVPRKKRCMDCAATKPSSAFNRNKYNLDGLTGRCKVCLVDWRRAQKYGLSKTAYEKLVRTQHGCCAICQRPFQGPKEPAVDHDHRTGTVRGLLCGACNSGLGYFEDDPQWLKRAAAYVRKRV